MSIEVLNVALKFTADGANLLAFINVMKSQLGLTHGKVTSLNSALGKLAIGGSLLVGGGLLLKTIADTAKYADETNTILTQMAAAGDSATQRQQAYNRAWTMTHDVVGKVSDNLEAISQMTPQFGFENALRMATDYRKNAVALGQLTGKDGNAEAYKLEQAVHQTGRLSVYDQKGNLEKNADGSEKVNTEAFKSTMNLFTAMIASSRGKIDAGQILAFTKQSRTSNLNTVSDEGFAHISGLIQTIGGSRSGTSLQAIENVAEKGQISKMGVHQLEAFGLVDKRKVTEGKGPNGVIIGEGGLADTKTFRSDPMKWVWTTVRDHIRDTLKSQGRDSSDMAVNEAAKKIKLSNTAGQWIGEGLVNQPMDQREADATVKAGKTSQYDAVMKNSAAANIQAFHDAMKNLGLAFGSQVLPVITGGVKALTGAITGLASFFAAHEGVTKAILAVGVGLGVAMVGTGIAILASLGPLVAIPLAIGAGVAGVIAAIVFVPKLLNAAWHLLTSAWDTVWHRGLLNLVSDFMKWQDDTVVKVCGAFLHGMDVIGGAMINGIGNLIMTVLKNAGHWLTGGGFIDDLKKTGHLLLGDDGKLGPTPAHPAMTPPPAKPTVIHNHTTVIIDNKEAVHKAVHDQLGVGKQGFGPSGPNFAGSWAPSGAFPSFG